MPSRDLPVTMPSGGSPSLETPTAADTSLTSDLGSGDMARVSCLIQTDGADGAGVRGLVVVVVTGWSCRIGDAGCGWLFLCRALT